MEFLKQRAIPYLVLGLFLSGVSMVFNGTLISGMPNPSAYIDMGVAYILGLVKMDPASGLGSWISKGVKLIVMGILAVLSVELAQRFVPVPSVPLPV